MGPQRDQQASVKGEKIDDDIKISIKKRDAAIASLSHTAEHNSIKNALHESMAILEALVNNTQKNGEGVEAAKLKSWKEKMANIIVNMVKTEVKDQQADRIINEQIQKYFDESSTDLVQCLKTSDEIIAEPAIKAMKEVAEAYDIPRYNKRAKKMLDTCQGIQENNAEDGDIMVEEEEFNDHKVKCPYTSQVMREPMKNTKCKHHISREGVDAMLKGSGRNVTARCAVAGCNAVWSRDSASLDEEFRVKVNRFLKMKERTQSSQFSQGGNNSRRGAAVAVDEEEE